MLTCFVHPLFQFLQQMHSNREMAIPRMFNSNTPFVIVTGGSELSFLGKEDNNSQGCEEEKDSLVQAIAPHLSRVMQLGTAKHVAKEGKEVTEEDPCVSIVAQAESTWINEWSMGMTTKRPGAFRCGAKLSLGFLLALSVMNKCNHDGFLGGFG